MGFRLTENFGKTREEIQKKYDDMVINAVVNVSSTGPDVAAGTVAVAGMFPGAGRAAARDPETPPENSATGNKASMPRPGS